MKTYKKAYRKVEDKTFCDICGECCTLEQFGTECATLEALWGYASKQDGSKYEIHLCEDCFMITISFLRNQRSKYISTPSPDPFCGQ